MEFHRKAGDISSQSSKAPRLLVAGVGAAGANILRRIVMDGGDPGVLVCFDTDLGTLNSCAAGKRIQLGPNLTKGLTAGGDPDLGREAALESEREIREAFRGIDLVFLCTGLGGGTASGAAPAIARMAREENCFVLVFVTLPFHFEGRRRQTQAREALAQIKPHAGALLTFENDRMGQLIVPTEGVQKAFAVADTTICHSVRAITTMLEKPGMIRVGLEQLLAVLNGQDARCLFGFGKAKGKDRSLIAVRAALENPLLHEGDLLASASTVLVHMSGNRSVTLAEVEQVMTEISSQLSPSIEVLFGVSASEEIGEELWVAIISSVSRANAATPVAAIPQPPPAVSLPVMPAPVAPLVSSPPPGPLTPAVAPAPATVMVSVAPSAVTPIAPSIRPLASPLISSAPFVESVVPGDSEDSPLVPPGPTKPRLKPPLPMPPAPAPIPSKVASVPPSLIGTEHLNAPSVNGGPSSEPLPVARPASPPPPAPTPGVQIDYTPRGPNGKGGPTTITLDPPQPSFLTRDGGAPTPHPSTSEALKGGDLSRNGQASGNGAGTPVLPADPSPTLLAMRHRGRFENSDPTLIDGQDMDLPTYIRKQRRPD